MYRSKFYIILLVGVLLWCLLIVGAPVAQHQGYPYTLFAGALYRSFSSLCHQDELRSFHLAGYKCAVCMRCTAIYFGFLVGVILSRFLALKRFHYPRVWWFIAVAPMLIDVGLDVLAINTSGMITRLVTGGIFGILAGIILTPYVIQACIELMYHQSQGVTYESKAR